MRMSRENGCPYSAATQARQLLRSLAGSYSSTDSGSMSGYLPVRGGLLELLGDEAFFDHVCVFHVSSFLVSLKADFNKLVILP